MNIIYYGKDMDINDMAKSSIKACKNSIHIYSNKLLFDGSNIPVFAFCWNV